MPLLTGKEFTLQKIHHIAMVIQIKGLEKRDTCFWPRF